MSLLLRYYQGATTPDRPSRRASLSFVWRYPRLHPWFAPAAPDATPGPGDIAARPPTWPTYSGGDDRASHVPGEPSCAYALLYDPGGNVPSRLCDRTTRPPPEPQRRLPTTEISRLNHTASALAVYASQDGSLRTTQDSLIVSWLGSRRDSIPAGFRRKVSKCSYITSSSFPMLHGARFVLHFGSPPKIVNGIVRR